MNYYESLVEQKLQDLKVKGVKCSKKKFNQYKSDYWVQISTLNLAENIGLQCGYENTNIEPHLNEGDADIKFYDEENHFLQVKCPKLFAIYSHGQDLIRFTNRFCKEVLSKSDSKFAVAYINENGYYKLFSKEINKPSMKASLGVVLYDAFFPSQGHIVDKLMSYIEKAYTQLKNIKEIGKKIILLDITFYPRASLHIYRALKWIYTELLQKKSNKIDGIAMFSWDPLNVVNDSIKSTIIPVVLNENVNSGVFKQNFHLYDGQMMSLPLCGTFKAQQERKWGFEDGYLKVDGVEYANFQRIMNQLKL
ncbi:hypothetical protein LCGC14_0973630 [marine sediment metagenome]|uniref:Uncharacterized protein n=1 Tax=marine sediment metagenome TaxID=412755 RepID=A0A0F9NAU6_9ZZZZ